MAEDRPTPPERDERGEITATAAWAAGTQPRQFDDDHYNADLPDRAVAAIIHHRRQSDDARRAFGEPIDWGDGILAAEESDPETRRMVREWVIRQEQRRLDQWRRETKKTKAEVKSSATMLRDALVDANSKDDVVTAVRGPGTVLAGSLRRLGVLLAKRWDRFEP